MTWTLENWCQSFSKNHTLSPITKKEIVDNIKLLQQNNYPIPSDCPKTKCPKHRLACNLGICKIAVCLCGDF